MVRAAFSGDGREGNEEVAIVERTWELDAAPAGLELVAVAEGEVIGHVLGARGDLRHSQAIAVAPLSVAPACQRQGVGTALMWELLGRAGTAGWPLVLVLGNPAYYSRFGFGPSAALGISYQSAGPHFMACRLSSAADRLCGEFRYCWEHR